MKLKTFIDNTGISVKRFSERVGVPPGKVHRLLHGKMPTLRTAVAIELYTKGEVTAKDLLPEEEFQIIERTKKK